MLIILLKLQLEQLHTALQLRTQIQQHSIQAQHMLIILLKLQVEQLLSQHQLHM